MFAGTKNMVLKLRDNFGKEGSKMKPSKHLGESIQDEFRRTPYDVNYSTGWVM